MILGGVVLVKLARRIGARFGQPLGSLEVATAEAPQEKRVPTAPPERGPELLPGAARSWRQVVYDAPQGRRCGVAGHPGPGL